METPKTDSILWHFVGFYGSSGPFVLGCRVNFFDQIEYRNSKILHVTPEISFYSLRYRFFVLGFHSIYVSGSMHIKHQFSFLFCSLYTLIYYYKNIICCYSLSTKKYFSTHILKYKSTCLESRNHPIPYICNYNNDFIDMGLCFSHSTSRIQVIGGILKNIPLTLRF